MSIHYVYRVRVDIWRKRCNQLLYKVFAISVVSFRSTALYDILEITNKAKLSIFSELYVFVLTVWLSLDMHVTFEQLEWSIDE